MYIVREYVVKFTDDDVMVVEMRFDPPNQMIYGCVNYHAKIRGHWVEVGRYDTAHGVPHVHRGWVKGAPARPLPHMSIPALVKAGKEDFLAHWTDYRARREALP